MAGKFKREKKVIKTVKTGAAENGDTDDDAYGKLLNGSQGFDQFSDDDGDGDDDDSNEDSDDVTEALEDEAPIKTQKRKLSLGDDAKEIIKKKKKKATGSLTKPPTAEEMARLRETENLFHSNLFRLQIDEMLRELKVKDKRHKSLNEWFLSLKACLSEMEEGKEYELMDQKWLDRKKVCVPLVQDPYPLKGVFRFLPPSSVSIVGSYAVGCSIGPRVNADIAVEMPKKCFQSFDYQNERYQRKRALYLCHIASHLTKQGLISTKEEFAPHFIFPRAANPLIPALEVVPSGKLEGRSCIQIHIVVPQETFKLSKLGPSKNLVRPAWCFEKLGSSEEKEKGPATPNHNAAISSDLVALANEMVQTEVLGSHQNLKDGIILLKVWLRQRELDKGFSTFGSYLMSMLVVHLLRTRRVSPLMSSYQVARTVWNFLKDSDWINKGVTMCDSPKLGAPTLDEFHNHYDVVFVDSTGYCNLAAHMDVTAFQRVKYESAVALQCLDNPSVNSFQVLFMTPAPFYRNFDHILCFHNIKALQHMVSKVSTMDQKLAYRHDPTKLAVRLLLGVLQKGLGKRVAQWGIQVPETARCKIGGKLSQWLQPILLGFRLDSEHAYSIVDKGPPADTVEAQEFRQFWGAKSELRRFQDGSISEAVVWLPEKNVTLAERRMVCRTISEYLFEHKLELDPTDSFHYLADQVESLLHLPQVKPAGFSYGTGEEATLAVLSSLDGLSAELRGLTDLPLDISGIQGTSSVFRYADAFPPLSTTHHPGKKITKAGKNCILLRSGHRSTMAPPWTPPVEVVLQLGLSGKWPDDAQAVRRIRAAFNIKICERLKSQCGLTAQPFPSHIDVLKDGFVFRLHVAYQREAALMRQVRAPDGMLKSVDCPEAQNLEKKTIYLPRITSYLHGLHQQLPAFGPTACLAKRWISAHMLCCPHFPELVVELLVARMFLSPEPLLPPAQPQTAFLRFLHFLSTTDWNVEPVILNFNNEMTRGEISEIEQKFTSDRVQLPPLFIATPPEREHSIWTKQAPSLTILLRVALLASESLKVLRMCYLEPSPSTSANWKMVFRPSLEVYDAVIRLHPAMNPRRAQQVDAEERCEPPRELEAYKSGPDEKIPVTGFDPVQCYIQELNENYDEFALFFHDTYGGNEIGVVWKPSALEIKDFKVSHVNGRRLDNGCKDPAATLVFNKDAIIEDFYILGKGLVNTIDIKAADA